MTDISGNVSTCSFDVTVNDDELPVVACTIDITQGSDLGTCDGTVAIAPLVATDNCAIASVSNDFNGTADASGVYPPGTTTVTWTVTDIHGNVTACSFDVTILDTEAPSLTCAGDITQTADGGVCEAAVTIAAPVYSDNCGIASISNDYNGAIDASDVYPVGTTTVTWTIIDMAGNTTTCSLDVTITDNEAPVVTCPSDITVNTDAGTCEANITVPNMIASDNCAILSIVNDYNSGTNASDVYAEGTTIVNWTITDIHGNVTTCSTTITVIDNENPIVACPVNVTQTADAGVCEAAVTIPVVTATDNCAVASIVNDYNGTADGSDTYPVGTTTVTWTITDIHGNVTTCQIDVVITDDEAPVVTCPSDITQPADGGSCDAVVTVDAMIATDNCAIASIINDYNGTSDASDIYTIGTTVVNWTITDIHGNVSTCVTTITITDDEAPVINCPASISQTADAGVCEALVSIPVPFTSDNCSVASVVNDYNGTNDGTDIYPVGTTTITWTVTDLAGNTSTCTMDVEVTDNEAPSITCQNDIVQNTDADLCEAFVTVPTLTIFENCAIASVTNDYNGTSDATDIYAEGTTTVVWTVIDIHGNVSTCSMNITITDNEAPVFTCPSALSQAADLGSCDAVVTMPAVTATDNCGVASIVNDYTGTDDASAIYTIGTTTISWTITDIHGNVSQCTQDITITDDESPILTCPADLTELVDSNCEFVVLDYTSLAVVTDNCDTDVMLTQSPVAGTVLSGSGTVEMITITATDDAGNETTCTFNVTLDDVIAPAITCPADLTEYVDATCNFELPDYTAMASTSDNCSVPVMTQLPAPGTIVGLGVYTITITSTDPDGNATDCSFDVTVLDNTAPIIACPGDQVEQLDTSCEHLLGDYTGLVSATDNCSSVTITQSPAAGTVIYVNTTITMTVEDIYGNVSTCNFEVILEDTIDPVITCPQDILVTNDLGVCGAVVTYDLPETSDNCTVADLSLTEGLASGEVFPVGTTVVTYVVTDGFGNTATCSFEVTVTDDEAPLIQCPDNIVAFNDLGVCGAMITFNDPVVSDNCAVDTVVMTEGMASGEVFPVGVTTISYDITDIHGNMNTCSFTIEILDNEAPVVAVCPSDITVINDNGICGAVVTYDAPTVTDNCAVIDITLVAGLDSGSTFDVGTTTVTWSYTDAAGNVSFCTFNVTVEDPEAPSIICPADIVVNNDNSICGAFVTYNMPQVDDNCAVADLQLISGIASGELFPVGVTELTFEVTDIYGNATQCSMTVTVIDAEDPIILCPEDIVQVDPVVYFNEPFFTDNCSATLTMIEGLPSGSVFPHGYTEVIYEAVDEAGNSVLCSFMVLVNTPPDAEDDTANFFEENDTIEIDPLGNDFDADGDDLTISEASASNGDVEIIGNYLYYTPADGWCGTDTITYIACDPFNACDSAIIVVQVECFIDLIIPQAISPNGDGINDVFEIIGLEDYPGNRLSVYNRWGRLVFEQDEYDNSFDGHSQDALTLGNGLLPEGTYFFVLDLGGAGIKPVKGYIYINR
ncbi:MAG: HYR domain-containing protein [Flavobacteriales bacterium]|nr:HYR domain-containing protein [Flavobacteriales bacterium]